MTDYPPDYGDMSCSYEEAEEITRIENATCRCPKTDGKPTIDKVNDLCEWHGGILERALASGRFWDPNDAWPWGERPAASRPGAGAGGSDGNG